MKMLSGQFSGKPVIKRQAAGLLIIESAHEPNDDVPQHSHQWPYFTVVLRGGYIERCQGQAMDVSEGQVVWHAAGEAHADRIQACGAYVLNVELSRHWMERIADVGYVSSRFAFQNGRVLQLCNRLRREVWNKDPFSELCIEGLALEVFAEIAQHRAHSSKEPWIRQAIEYLQANFKESPTLEQVAQAAGVHPVHLARVFRRKQGYTVGDFVRALRVDFVSRQLSITDKTIVEIALEAGFSDHSHMTRVFRQQKGQTPSEFRQLHRHRTEQNRLP